MGVERLVENFLLRHLLAAERHYINKINLQFFKAWNKNIRTYLQQENNSK